MRVSLFAALPLLGALALTPQRASAQLTTRVWIGAVGRYVLNDNDTFTSPGFGTVGLQVKGSSVGFGGDAEYRMNNWFGIDGALGYSKLNVQYTSSTQPGVTKTSGLGIVPVLVALNVHLVHAQSVDIWVGPQVGYVLFTNDLSYASNGGTFSYKPKSTFSKEGFVIGADIAMSRNMKLNLATRWQNADGDGNDMLLIDPTFVTIGLTWKR